MCNQKIVVSGFCAIENNYVYCNSEMHSHAHKLVSKTYTHQKVLIFKENLTTTLKKRKNNINPVLADLHFSTF